VTPLVRAIRSGACQLGKATALASPDPEIAPERPPTGPEAVPTWQKCEFLSTFLCIIPAAASQATCRGGKESPSAAETPGAGDNLMISVD